MMKKVMIQSVLHRDIAVPTILSLKVQGSWEGELPITLNCLGNEVSGKLNQMK